jgi:hypothetical protein
MSLAIQGKDHCLGRLFNSSKPQKVGCPTKREGGGIERWKPKRKQLE